MAAPATIRRRQPNSRAGMTSRYAGVVSRMLMPIASGRSGQGESVFEQLVRRGRWSGVQGVLNAPGVAWTGAYSSITGQLTRM